MFTKVIRGFGMDGKAMYVNIGPISIQTNPGSCVPYLRYEDDESTITMTFAARDGFMEVILDGDERRNQAANEVKIRFSDPIECTAVRKWFAEVVKTLEKVH